MIKRILLSIVTVYVLIVIGMYLLQGSLLYIPNKLYPNPGAAGLAGITVLDLKAEDGTKLLAWYQPASEGKPTIVYFHGNGGHIGYRGFIARRFIAAGYGILLLSYRGYGGSEGKPSEQGLYQDARASIDYLLGRGVQPSCLIFYGESLGSAVAVQMATEYPVGGLILQAPFSNLAEAAKVHYPFLPVSLMLKEKYDSLKKIKTVSAPIILFHGEKDRIVPVKQGKRLYQEANEPKELVIYQDSSHNNLNSQLIIDKAMNFFNHNSRCS